jgi:hypothetical protein
MATKLDPRLGTLVFIVQQMAHEIKKPELALQCSELMADIELRTMSGDKDGRSTAWNDKRKAEVGAKIRAAHEARREVMNLAHRFLKYQYADVKPIEIQGLDELAKETDLNIKTVQNKLSENPDGFSVNDRATKTKIFYARASDQEAIDRLLYQEHQKLSSGYSSEGSGTYVLPSKKNKRF